MSLTHRIRAIAVGATAVAGAHPAVPTFLLRFVHSIDIWFWAMIVGLPTRLAGVYYFGIASDQYLSQAEFVAHGPSKTPTSALRAPFSSGRAMAGADDWQMSSAALVAACLLAYGILWLLVAGVREHASA